MWGGDAEHAHTFGTAAVKRRGNLNEDFNHRWNSEWAAGGKQTEARPQEISQGTFCPCGAWLGSLGLEPTPELFVEHLVDVFREVRRVLRADGCCWINLGDSYAGSGNGSNDHREAGASTSKNDLKYQGQKPGQVRGLPAKSLMMMPARVAMALQADGWILRSMLPWVKRSAMPESVVDRPSTAVEYWFLLSKGPRYFWDPDAVRVASDPKRTSFTPGHKFEDVHDTTGRAIRNDGLARLGQRMNEGSATGRSMRNSDLFWATWQGLLLDDDDQPMSLVVNPAGSKLQHYASFPPKLIEPLIKASTSERGACSAPGCGAPWVRTTVRQFVPQPDVRDPLKLAKASNKGMDTSNGWGETPRGTVDTTTTDWRPSCGHSADLPTVPCVVLDPFGGSGTTGLVADRLGRDAILCELSDSYGGMATDRLVGDNPMFTSVEVA